MQLRKSSHLKCFPILCALFLGRKVRDFIIICEHDFYGENRCKPVSKRCGWGLNSFLPCLGQNFRGGPWKSKRNAGASSCVFKKCRFILPDIRVQWHSGIRPFLFSKRALALSTQSYCRSPVTGRAAFLRSSTKYPVPEKGHRGKWR